MCCVSDIILKNKSEKLYCIWLMNPLSSIELVFNLLLLLIFFYGEFGGSVGPVHEAPPPQWGW